MSFKLYITEDYNKFNDINYYNNYKEYIEIIDVTKTDYNKENIFYLHTFLNEFTTLYYVWKNNLYSDYVGFCHYHKLLNLDIIIPLIGVNKFDYFKCDNSSGFKAVFFNILNISSIKNKFEKYLFDYDPKLFNIYKEKHDKVNGRSLFITRYENFIKLVEFLYNFILYIFENKNLSVLSFIQFINTEIKNNINISFDNNYVVYDYLNKNIYRLIGFFIEYMCGLYIEYDIIINKKTSIYINRL